MIINQPNNLFFNFARDSLSSVRLEFREQIIKKYNKLQKDKALPPRENVYIGEVGRTFISAAAAMRKASISIFADDDELQSAAKQHARACARAGNLKYAALHAQSAGIVPPKHDCGVTERAAFNRLMCPNWWHRKLRKYHKLHNETAAVRCGLVSAKSDIYCSNFALVAYRQQQQRNAAIVKKLHAVNEDEEQIELAEIIKRSIAAPAVRRAELMVRMRGFEDYAKANKYASVFFTCTAPSAYHSTLKKSGAKNKHYKGYTPRDAQNYLCKVWAQARAKLKRDELAVFGFRVAEPHHDGTPHWHILLFMKPEETEQITEILRSYFCAADAFELYNPQRRRARFDSKNLSNQGISATGYIAKYIAKNVGHVAGAGMDFDKYGKPIEDYCERVRAWASLWSIRQFQQIGGAPVSYWRELRRLREPVTECDTIEKLRAAADGGDWQQYTALSGGGFVTRKLLPLALLKDEIEEAGMYGDSLRITKGVFNKITSVVVKTRDAVWQILPKAKDAVQELASNVHESLVTAARLAAPWSSVNNCTQKYKEVFDIFPDNDNFKFNLPPPTAAALLYLTRNRSKMSY